MQLLLKILQRIRVAVFGLIWAGRMPQTQYLWAIVLVDILCRNFQFTLQGQDGGGFYGNQAGTWTMNTMWYKNLATGGSGGALYLQDSTVMMNSKWPNLWLSYLADISLINNVAGNGGGCYLKGSSNMFWGVTATKNLANVGGILFKFLNWFSGAFYAPGATVIVWNSTVEYNRAAMGGAIYVDGSTFISYNTTLEHNRANQGITGAGAYLVGSTLVFTNVTLGVCCHAAFLLIFLG